MFTNGGYWKYKVDPANASQVIWENVTEEVAMKDDYHQLQAVFRGDGDTETHGGEDVAAFAQGYSFSLPLFSFLYILLIYFLGFCFTIPFDVESGRARSVGDV